MHTNQLTEAWLQIKNRWHELTPRDKKAVLIGSGVLAIVIFYAGIWSPFMAYLDTMRQRIHSQQKTLSWMQSADQDIQRLQKESGGAHATLTPVALLAYTQLKINQAGLATNLVQIKQTSSDSVGLQFKEVSFDKLMTLLIAMLKEQAISVTRMSAVSQDAQGVANVELTLTVSH